MKKFRTGLVLSGGGARGMAHAGVLRALDEIGIKPDIISATSAGAIVGALYSGGMKPEAITGVLKGVRLFDLTGISFDFKGIMKPNLFRQILNRHLNAKRFEDLEIPMIVNATDINNARTVYFSSGDLVQPLVASCALPVVFSPLNIGGHSYVDGGLLNNFPVEPLEGICDRIIGVHVNPISVREKPVPVTRVLERCFHMAISSTIKPKEAFCDIFIEPPQLSEYGVFEIEKASEIAFIGYTAAMAKSKEIFALKA